MPLPSLTAALRRELVAAGRDDLALRAVDRVSLTFDGTTLYVHLFPKDDWRRRIRGEALVLAHADLEELPPGLTGIRQLLQEARRWVSENGERIARWLENR